MRMWLYSQYCERDDVVLNRISVYRPNDFVDTMQYSHYYHYTIRFSVTLKRFEISGYSLFVVTGTIIWVISFISKKH